MEEPAVANLYIGCEHSEPNLNYKIDPVKRVLTGMNDYLISWDSLY